MLVSMQIATACLFTGAVAMCVFCNFTIFMLASANDLKAGFCMSWWGFYAFRYNKIYKFLESLPHRLFAEFVVLLWCFISGWFFRLYMTQLNVRFIWKISRTFLRNPSARQSQYLSGFASHFFSDYYTIFHTFLNPNYLLSSLFSSRIFISSSLLFLFSLFLISLSAF